MCIFISPDNHEPATCTHWPTGCPRHKPNPTAALLFRINWFLMQNPHQKLEDCSTGVYSVFTVIYRLATAVSMDSVFSEQAPV